MKKIHYIGWFIENNDALYFGNIPGKLKMEYVINTIVSLGYYLEIFSLSDKKCQVCYSNKRKKTENYYLRYTAGINTNNKFGKYLNSLFKKIQFCFYILFFCHSNDIIIMYHSVPYTRLLASLKKVFNRKVICREFKRYKN